ncbi:hypothetical protein Daus18300_005773 [Diaporthe australafricana]|uniref:Uncharacterized protein n=1 Tax=Diaporthe australafricana TaxID=127596 RepID=A0ABR3WZ52_9PEZI
MSLLKRFPILLASILAFILTAWSLHNSFSTANLVDRNPSQICPRDPATSYFQGQFSNPAGVLSVLLLVGGDTVQKAVAQMTGGRHAVFTPVVFSFGWVSYSVSMVATAFGDAIFLPRPEYSGYVVNVGTAKAGVEDIASGDRRENRSWHLGRLMRDLELSVKTEKDEIFRQSGLLVTVYRLDPARGGGHPRLHPKKDWLWWIFAWAIPCQLVIAMLPWIFQGDWSIFLITSTGNLLAILTASLPSMRNLQYRKDSQQSYALTRGNGHRHVFIIRPDSYHVDKDENEGNIIASRLPYLDDLAVNIERADRTARGLSIVCAVFWIMLLVAVGGLKSGTWYLFGAGTLGMLFNILISSYPRDPAAYGLPLKEEARFGFRDTPSVPRKRVQEVLLELEVKYPGAGHALKPLFFTTSLLSKKDEVWKEDAYSWETAKQRLLDLKKDGNQVSQQPSTEGQS